MIVNKEQTVVTETSGVVRTKQMGIDPNSVAHIMGILTDLYSDPAMAVIREYTTNALDSHVAAGKGDVPITVTLPSIFSDSFVVKDEGVGLSEEEVFEIYGNYGASTKRESNDFTGQLGLGCKSALTLTNQFSLVAIKDGVKCAFSVHKDEFGVPRMTELYQAETEEPNGVEITVPVKNIHEFRRKAEKFFRFVEPKPVFINDADFNPTIDVLMGLTPTIKFLEGNGGRPEDYVVMGNVAYPIKASEFSQLDRHYLSRPTLALYAEMGDVDFTPSREELHYTKRTRSFIQNKLDEVTRLLASQITKDLVTAKNYIEATELYNKHDYNILIRAFRLDLTPTYKGVPLINGGPSKKKFSQYYLDANDRLLYRSRLEIIPMHSLRNAIVLSGEKSELTQTYRNKLKDWMHTHDKKDVYYIEGDIKEYFEPAIREFLTLITDVDDLKPIKVATTTTRKPSVRPWPKLSPALSQYGKAIFTKEKPQDTETIVYAGRMEYHSSMPTLTKLFPNVSFYGVTPKQADGFCKAFPKAQRLQDFLASKYTQEFGKLTEDQKRRLAGVPYGIHFNLPIEAVPHIKDDALREFGKLIESASTGPIPAVGGYQWGILLRICESHGISTKLYYSEIKRLQKELTDIADKLSKDYPLLFGNSHNSQAYIDYANAISEKEGRNV